MLAISRFSLAFALVLQASALASAQGLSEKVWAVFAYNLPGDNTPTALPRPNTLSPYGASELYAAGSSFRDHYVTIHSDENAGASTRIQNLSPWVLDSEEVVVLSTTEQAIVASAQAFMQGLYPPLAQSGNMTYVDSSSLLANGSLAMAPFQGYQYPRISTLSPDDPHSVALAGNDQCLAHQVKSSEYQSSSEFQQMTQVTEAFYIDLYDQALSGVYGRSSASYKNAVEIAEYLEYELVHNETLLHVLGRDDIQHARWLADQYLFATNGRTTSGQSAAPVPSAEIRTIAGRTLASRILEAFNTNIQYRGANEKLTLAFGGSEPVIALASLTKLASRYGDYYPHPHPGASMIFELYSLENATYPVYPDSSELYVRFLLHNGTSPSTGFTPYPLFGHGPSSIAIPYNEFQAELEQYALRSTREWCLKCGSTAVFCSGVLSKNKEASSSDDQMDPTAAGGIGAVVTFIVYTIGIVVVFMAVTLRKHKSGPGGFKKDRKMASDTDVTFKNPVWGDSKTEASQKPGGDDGNGVTVRGQERSGSWEMTENKERDPASPTENGPRSPFSDEIEEEVLIHSAVEPAKVRESV